MHQTCDRLGAQSTKQSDRSFWIYKFLLVVSLCLHWFCQCLYWSPQEEKGKYMNIYIYISKQKTEATEARSIKRKGRWSSGASSAGENQAAEHQAQGKIKQRSTKCKGRSRSGASSAREDQAAEPQVQGKWMEWKITQWSITCKGTLCSSIQHGLGHVLGVHLMRQSQSALQRDGGDSLAGWFLGRMKCLTWENHGEPMWQLMLGLPFDREQLLWRRRCGVWDSTQLSAFLMETQPWRLSGNMPSTNQRAASSTWLGIAFHLHKSENQASCMAAAAHGRWVIHDAAAARRHPDVHLWFGRPETKTEASRTTECMSQTFCAIQIPMEHHGVFIHIIHPFINYKSKRSLGARTSENPAALSPNVSGLGHPRRARHSTLELSCYLLQMFSTGLGSTSARHLPFGVPIGSSQGAAPSQASASGEILSCAGPTFNFFLLLVMLGAVATSSSKSGAAIQLLARRALESSWTTAASTLSAASGSAFTESFHSMEGPVPTMEHRKTKQIHRVAKACPPRSKPGLQITTSPRFWSGT